MIRDYLKTGVGTSPLSFAENYYIHYPKVAVGIWPPFFHATAALWMLLFTRTHTALLLFIAFQGALCAAILACFARRLLPASIGFLLGLLVILLPAFQNATSVVMIDLLVAVMDFWAMLMMVEFFRTGSMRDAICFGASVGLAMMTKSNANALVLAGVCMMVLTRQFAILQRLPVYVAGVIIALLGGPWQLIMLRLFKNTIPLAHLTISRFWIMFSGYIVILVERLSLPIFLLALVGLAAECIPLLRGRRRDSGTLEVAAAASLLLGIVFFHSMATNSDPDDRYILPALPLLLLFAALGIRFIALMVPVPRFSVAARAAVLVVLGLGWFAKTVFAIPHRPQMGYAQAASTLLPAKVGDETVLVCSDSWGEGALVTTLALGDHAQNEHIVIRGTKVLSESLWLGGIYSPLFHSSSALEQYLESIPLDAVVVDLTKVLWEEDRAILSQAILENPDKWSLTLEVPETPESRHLRLYRWVGPDHSNTRKNVRVRMRLMLGRDLELK